MNDVPAAIKAARLRRKWTQQQLADAAGVTQGTISRLETPGYECSVATLLMIAAALDARLTVEIIPR